MKEKKIVIVNQAINYLTIGIANEFVKEYDKVAVITGSVHVQGEELDHSIEISKINKYTEKSLKKKLFNWFFALFKMYYFLLFKYRKYEILYITNPPMVYFLSSFLPQKFSILIWDVYPDMLKIFGMSDKNLVYKIWTWINKRLFKHAETIFTIGNRISELLAKYVDRDKITIVPLWTIFNKPAPIPKDKNPFVKEHQLEQKFIVQYSGNIGITHNVEVLLPVAEKLLEEKNILFQIIGRGTRVNEIQKRIGKKELKNSQWLPFQSDEMFPYSLAAADLGVVILDDRTSQGSVPSKTYNLMTSGKPILYIASKDSELYDYALKFKNGECFHSTQIDEIADFIKRLASDHKQYEILKQNSLKASLNFMRKNASLFVKKISVGA